MGIPLDIGEIVEFWRNEQKANSQGLWAHRLDWQALNSGTQTFNLDYPVSPYIGNVLDAPVIILNANAGFNSDLTPDEFTADNAIRRYLDRVDNPSDSDWSTVSHYYNGTNYGQLVASGKAVVVNACAYRSPKISDRREAANRAMIKRLPSTIFAKKWLIQAVLPMAEKRGRLVVINRGGLWNLGSSFKAVGVVRDPCPRSPNITSNALEAMTKFLATHT